MLRASHIAASAEMSRPAMISDGPIDGRAKRLEHFRGRLLDEHLPAQRIDRRVGRQHRGAAAALRDHRERFLRALAQRVTHLRQLREVGLAQHQADVGVGDELPGAVDDVGLAGAPDLDAADDVPDELEVDLGDGDRARVAAGAHGDGEVGLRLLAEVHRAEPGLAGPGVQERRIARAVLVGAGDVHGEARHGELLAALGVDPGNVGHRRDQAQQLQELDAPLLDAGGAELRQRRERELLLDLAHELLDARRRADRLLALQAEQRRLVLLVREVQADRARDEERAADQPEDQQEVLAEQAPALDRADLAVLRDQGVDRLHDASLLNASTSRYFLLLSSARAIFRFIS